MCERTVPETRVREGRNSSVEGEMHEDRDDEGETGESGRRRADGHHERRGHGGGVTF